MGRIVNLDQIRVGESCKVISVEMENYVGRRLKELGIVAGCEIKCYAKGLGMKNAMKGYMIKNTILALRKEETKSILVEVIENNALNIVLAGNPNVGKSTIFNGLTGLKQHTGNWAGKTVESAKGEMYYGDKKINILDVPGCYSIFASSKDEVVAKEMILDDRVDGVVVVCDATCLERNLLLVLQTMAIKSNVILCVNLMDEAKNRNISIDLSKLSRILEIPVVATSARNKKGLEELSLEMCNINEISNARKSQSILNIGEVEELDIDVLINNCKEIDEKVVVYGEDRRKFTKRADKLLMGKYTDIPIMILMLMGIFWITITGANIVSDRLSIVLMALKTPLLSGLIVFHVPKMICDMIVNGVYNTLAWVVSVMLPPMAIFFPLFTLLEDLGVLPRIAFNMDGCFKCCKACGKQALTMAMGFGCNASAIASCRIIDSKRERLIAMITNTFMPCNGRLPAIIAVITIFFTHGKNSCLGAVILTGLILFGVLMTFILSLILSKTILKGYPSNVIIEMPQLRKPKIMSILIRSVLDRTIKVLVRAMKVAAPAGMLIWILGNFTLGGEQIIIKLASAVDPIGWLIGLDGATLLAFALGWPANEIVIPILAMTYMQSNNLINLCSIDMLGELIFNCGWNIKMALCFMVFSILHWPCATTFFTIKKESESMKWALVSLAIPMITAFLVTGIFNGIFVMFS